MAVAALVIYLPLLMVNTSIGGVIFFCPCGSLAENVQPFVPANHQCAAAHQKPPGTKP
jgi:hypothetical protein